MMVCIGYNFDPQGIFFRAVIFATIAPVVEVVVENQHPFFRIGYRIKSVSSFRQRVTRNPNGVGKRNFGRFIGAESPDPAVRNERAENLPSSHSGSVVRQGDFTQADALLYFDGWTDQGVADLALDRIGKQVKHQKEQGGVDKTWLHHFMNIWIPYQGKAFCSPYEISGFVQNQKGPAIADPSFW